MNHEYLTATELLTLTARECLTTQAAADAFTQNAGRIMRRLGEDINAMAERNRAEVVLRHGQGSVDLQHPSTATINIRPIDEGNDFRMAVTLGGKPIIMNATLTAHEDLADWLDDLCAPMS